MAANTSPVFVASVKTGGVQFANADGTTLKTLYTAGANGSRIASIFVSTTDTSANNIGLYIQVGGAGTAYPIGAISAAALSGALNGATAPVAGINLLTLSSIPALQSDGSLLLGAADVLQASVGAAVTAAKTLTLVVQGGDY